MRKNLTSQVMRKFHYKQTQALLSSIMAGIMLDFWLTLDGKDYYKVDLTDSLATTLNFPFKIFAKITGCWHIVIKKTPTDTPEIQSQLQAIIDYITLHLEQTYHMVSSQKELLEVNEQLGILEKVLEKLQESAHLEEVVQMFLNCFEENAIYKAESGWFFSFDRSKQRFLLVSNFGKIMAQQMESTACHDSFYHILANKTGQIINHAQQHQLWSQCFPNIDSLLFMPLYQKNKAIGLLILGATQSQAFTSYQLKQTMLLASIIANIIEYIRLYEIAWGKEQFSEAVLEYLDYGLIAVDKNGDLLKSNKIAYDITGWQETSIYGESIAAILGQPKEWLFNIFRHYNRNQLIQTTITIQNKPIQITMSKLETQSQGQLGYVLILKRVLP